MDKNFKNSVVKKCYEISYALFRLPPHIESKIFSAKLEEFAADLIIFSNKEDLNNLSILLSTVEYFMHLGADVNIIHPETADVIVKEAARLNSYIVDYKKEPKKIKLESAFSVYGEGFYPEKKGDFIGIASGFAGSAKDTAKSAKYTARDTANNSEEVAVYTAKAANDAGNTITRTAKGAAKDTAKIAEYTAKAVDNTAKDSARPAELINIRRSMIIGKIRELKMCKFKDIQESLPKDISERTIRYDIDSLIKGGIVERMGNSGPNIYYKIKNGFLSDFGRAERNYINS